MPRRAAPFAGLVTIALVFPLVAACGRSSNNEPPPTMVPSSIAQGDPSAMGGAAGSCARLALCCREIYAEPTLSASGARTACGSLSTLANGGAGSEASCAASLSQVVSMASIGGVVPTSCRGPEAAAMGSLGALGGSRVPSMRGRHVTIPSTVNGSLVTGDSVDTDGALFDEYRVFLSAGSPVTLVARGGPSRTNPGSNLDMYLVLQQNGVEVTHDDDSAGSLNSRIVFTPVTSGWYQVRVRTFGSGAKEGDYTLQTWAGALSSAT
jgi:hypothetical protein